MTIKKIPIVVGGKPETATLDYDERVPVIRLALENGWSEEFKGSDIYECLGKIIKSLPEIKFLCKGAKLNVRPSSMSSQMTSGIMAYEHKIGVRATRKDIVNIFDYDDKEIINEPRLQTEFFHRWLESIKKVKD
ncbi:hypothetical protein [Pseudomonas mandelii]|uniref:DUF3010 family protein n=1 Tax=Pseudomonas mandelii TaxID=75612 RepID=A0ABY0VT72_9PSED|nr:hypothetical protein [Pseudomonas mandelii]TWS11199.1 hypothetical protein FJD35_05395 [Pseudomonas mandelii]SDU54144.1 hypothetical protein SAMN04489801_4183 [Pseudomonas mandelii]